MQTDRATNSDHQSLFLAWLGLFAAPLFLDWVLNRRQSGLTFSESTRTVLDGIPYGREAFAVGWPGFALWFWLHILRPRSLRKRA